MKIGPKLTISFDCIMVLMAVTGGMFFWSQKQLLHDGEKISRAYAKATGLKDISLRVSRQINAVRNIVVSGSNRGHREFLVHTEEVLYQFGKLENMIHDDVSIAKEGFEKAREEEKGLEVANLKQQYSHIVNYCDDILKSTQHSDGLRNVRGLTEFIENEFDKKFTAALEKMTVLEEHEILVVRQHTQRYEAFLRTVSWAILGLSVVTTIFLSIFISRTISKPIARLREAAEKIGDGDLQARIDACSRDEVGELGGTLQKMAANLGVTIENLSRELEWHEQMEEEYKQLVEKLEKANRELKDFAYVVSHDLKAPLRGIKTLVEWFTTDYADKVDEDGERQLKLLTSRVDRMHNLIEGVLQYSRIGRVKEQELRVDLNELVTKTIDTVATPENITVTIENKLPEIVCEKTRIGQVFGNLISNAVKFMDKPQGWVKIRYEDRKDFWEFSVADNGPGIEEKHFEHIFKIFQRLSGNDGYESTGVGLAFVKKIVELYGGTVWVKSKTGEGSTFYFTLPKRKAEVRDGMALVTAAH